MLSASVPGYGSPYLSPHGRCFLGHTLEAFTQETYLAAVTRGQLGPALLDTYEPERRAHVWEMIRLALRMGRVMTPRNRVAAWSVQSGLRLLGLWTPRPGAMFAAARQPIWDRLRVGAVAVLPRGVAGEALPGVDAVRDRDGGIAAALARYPDHVLLLRPDHYVAACMPAADITGGAKRVAALVGLAGT